MDRIEGANIYTLVNRAEETPEEELIAGLTIDAWKGIIIAVIFVICIIGEMIPYFFKTGKVGKYVLTIGTAFGGGVFLSAGLLHLLPEAIEQYEEIMIPEDSEEEVELYPWVEVIALIGFLLIFFIEYILIDHGTHEALHGHDEDNEKSLLDGKTSSSNEETNEVPPEVKMDVKTKISQQVDPSLVQYSQLTVIILLLALSVHAFLTGFGLGIQDTMDDITVYFIAIVAHKIFEAFAMSVSIQRSPLTFVNGIIMNGVLAAMTPLGIGIGMAVLVAVRDNPDVANWIQCIANALSCGTFLYVSICEVIMKEFTEPFDHHDKKRSKRVQWFKFLALVLGIVVMALVAMVL